MKKFNLTETQMKIWGLLCCGKSRKEIGSILVPALSCKTVEYHINSPKTGIYEKLSVNSDTALVKLGIENGVDKIGESILMEVEDSIDLVTNQKIEIKSTKQLAKALLIAATAAANGKANPVQVNCLCQATSSLIELMRFQLILNDRESASKRLSDKSIDALG